MNKTLLAIWGFLLLFILGAGGYYFYTQNGQTAREVAEDTEPREFSLARSLLPTPMPGQVGTEFITAPISTEQVQAFLNTLAETDGDFLTNSYINNFYVGKVQEVSQAVEEFNGVTYGARIVLVSESGKILALRFTQNELTNMEISAVAYQENGDYTIESPEFSEIVAGDKVIVSRTTNLLDPNLNSDRVGIEIRK